MKVSVLFLYIVAVPLLSCSQTNTTTFEQGDMMYRYESFNEVKEPKALLVLFNGGAGIATGIPAETALPDSAVSYQIKTIGIDQSQLFLSDTAYSRIRQTILHVMQKHAIDKLFIGGFSIGGYTAIRLTEMAVERADSALIPNAIFAVDSPIDHIELREYCFRELARKCPNEEANISGKGEARWILDYYNQHFGDFEEDSTLYVSHSGFTALASDGGNAKFLHSIPVQLIHEIDIMWLVEERCRDLRDTNAFSGSKFIKFLYDIGNLEAMATLTTDKGYRSDGRRHPHSWSIADPQQTIEWLMEFAE